MFFGGNKNFGRRVFKATVFGGILRNFDEKFLECIPEIIRNKSQEKLKKKRKDYLGFFLQNSPDKFRNEFKRLFQKRVRRIPRIISQGHPTSLKNFEHNLCRKFGMNSGRNSRRNFGNLWEKFREEFQKEYCEYWVSS